jgi:hypothetical protein
MSQLSQLPFYQNSSSTAGNPKQEQNSNLHQEPAGETTFYREQKIRANKIFYTRIIICILFLNLILILETFSQTLTISGLTVTNSTQITVKGDMLNAAGSQIDNNGVIELTGDFTNNSGSGLFATSAGTVILNGANQDIGGSSATEFNNLNLSGSGNKTLLQDVKTGGAYSSPSGILSLNSNMLDLNSHILTVSNSLPSAISRTSGFIVSETDALTGYGKIIWNISNSTGNFIFPFGNASSSDYLPLAFNITAAGTGTDGSLTAATYPTITSNTPNNRPLPAGLTSLISWSGTDNSSNTADRWWVIESLDYTTAPISTVSLTYRDSEWDNSASSTNTITESLLRAQTSNGTTWSPVMGTVNTGANVVTVSGVNNYNSFWTLAGNDGPLPITLLSFEATLNALHTVDLLWSTATEINCDFFTLEKSPDGLNFKTFGTVGAAGNSNTVLNYNFIDENPFEGFTYYRLKSTDFDGSYKYSEIRKVRIQNIKGNTFSVYPNPASESFNIINAGTDNNFILKDASGKTVKSITSNSDDDEIKVNRDGLASGIYFISRSDNKTIKVIFE